MQSQLKAAIAAAFAQADTNLRLKQPGRAFEWLERAHILTQRHPYLHAKSHWLMLRLGLQTKDYREVLGQIPRIVAALLFSRIWVPIGNTGRARVSAFLPMPVPEDLQQLLANDN